MQEDAERLRREAEEKAKGEAEERERQKQAELAAQAAVAETAQRTESPRLATRSTAPRGKSNKLRWVYAAGAIVAVVIIGILIANSSDRPSPATVTPVTTVPSSTLAPTPTEVPALKPTLTPISGYALQFDGIDDFVSITDNGVFDFGDAFTVEAWVKPLSLDGSGVFKAIAQGAFSEPPFTGGGWVVYLGESDDSNWGLSVCIPDCNAAESGAGSLQVGQWQHLASVYDGTNITIYRNGVMIASQPHSGDVTDINFVLIGIWVTSFNGLIDEVRVWNVARSQAEVQANMNQILIGSEAGLVGYWRFDEGGGQAVFDNTSNGNGGRLGASPTSENNDPAWVTSDAPLR